MRLRRKLKDISTVAKMLTDVVRLIAQLVDWFSFS